MMGDSSTETILVVDDEETLADLFTAYLAPEYDVRTATSGEEALGKADDEVDVILLDRRMPQMSGDEVLDELVKREIGAMVGMLSGVDADVDIVELPFDDYLLKPATKSEVTEFVETLHHRSEMDECRQQYFALESKKNALEQAGRYYTEEYTKLLDRMTEIQNQIDGASLSVGDHFPDVSQDGPQI